ncbi:MAG: phosphatase [Chloroflexi bacterium RBG_16_57_8]|nr:MAG: phosphatase [Chloroflexi bacterium RBG_16_57_8]
MSKVDLHVHTNASDGRYPPAEVIRRAARAGLGVIAITDHDTVGGIAPALEAARSVPGLRVIPGVEINTDVPSGEAHVLGYFIDHSHLELLALLSDMRDSRQDRGQKMVAKLEKLGMPVSWGRVKEIGGTESIGRPHIAQAMLEKGYISSIREAFDRYIGWGGPAYVERAKVSPAEATRLILRASGLPVLAHPLTIGEPEAMILELKTAGLVGIEVYYGGYSAPDISRLLTWAGKYELIATGGSDFHGLDEKAETPLGGAGVPTKAAQDLIALAEARAARPAWR